MNRNKIIGIAFAGIMLLSVVGGNVTMNGQNLSPVQNAQASHDCGYVDAGVAAVTFTYVNRDKCLNNHVSHAVQETREAEANQTKTDYYAALTAQEEQAEVTGALYDNYLQDTETVAWSKAETAMAENYSDKITKAELKVKAKEAIANYYATKQKNLIEDYRATVQSHRYMIERAVQENYVAQPAIGQNYYSDRGYITHSHNNSFAYSGSSISVLRFDDRNVTLVNNEEYNTDSIVVHAYDNEGNQLWSPNGQEYYLDPSVSTIWENSTEMRALDDGNYESAFQHFYVKPPNDNYESAVTFVPGEYSQRFERIEELNENLQNESDQFVEAVWQDLESGELNRSEIISRNTLMFEYGTEAAGGNGSYYDVVGATAGMGLSMPDLNGTGQMQVTYNGNEYYGMLFARNVPGGSWESGRTYNTSNFDGPVMFGSVDGSLNELSGEFTIDEITNKEGEEQESVETVQYQYKVGDTSELEEKYDKLLQFTQELEDRQDEVAGGGGSVSSGGLVDWLFSSTYGIPNAIFVFAGLAVLSLLGRGN